MNIMTNTENSSVEPLSQLSNVEGPGARLRRAREDAELTIEAVASSLCLRVSVIQDLERDKYEAMPGHVFCRGYLRAYAKIIGQDADELIALFNSLNIEDKNSDNVVRQSRSRTVPNERPVRGLFLITTAVIMVLAAVWFFSNRGVSKNGPLEVSPHKATITSSLPGIHTMEVVNIEPKPLGNKTEAKG